MSGEFKPKDIYPISRLPFAGSVLKIAYFI